MRLIRRSLLLFLVLLPAFIMGQEMTVEQSFLQQSIEQMIIREMSRGESREMKQVALEFIGQAIDSGNTSDEIRASLEFLAMEGIVNVTRESGRITNNFPDIRRSAARYLGMLGTPEAKDALVRMVLLDNEPLVITEAIVSLMQIGLNDGGEVVTVITWIVNRFNNLNPDNVLALAAIEAFETFAEIDGFIDPAAIRTVMSIAEGPYSFNVRERARQSLNDLRRYAFVN